MFGPHLPRSFRSTAHASARRARVGAVPGVAWAVPQICDLKNPNSVTGQIFAWRLSRGSNALPSVELQTPQMRSIEAEANSSAGPGTERERERVCHVRTGLCRESVTTQNWSIKGR